MARSFAETVRLNCPKCEQPFYTDIWLIVDAEERPDLIERVRDGEIHKVCCDKCDYEGSVNISVLVHLPENEQVFFMPPQNTDEKQDQEMLGALLRQLAENYDTPPEYFKETRMVSQQVLSVLLGGGDPEAVLRQMAKKAAEAVENIQTETPQ